LRYPPFEQVPYRWDAADQAEGEVRVAADVTMLVGNGYVPGHADFALGLIRGVPAVRNLFERRVAQ
jgi:L-erythro-3,5-diaminohexanoate dehydrogenase